MRQLSFEAPGKVRWVEVPEPELAGAGAALVRPLTVSTCDLDVAAVRGGYPMEGPYPLGHEGVAEVIEIGDEVTTVEPGDRVIVPFQISCGRCSACRRGRTANCTSVPKLSTYGLGKMGGLQWGGFLTDLTHVPHADAMLVPLPDGVDAEAIASASDNMSDAWRCVGPQLAAEPGAEVLVVGGVGGPSSIGLYATGLAVALGASKVTYLDQDPARLAIAAALGADVRDTEPPRKAGAFPITVDASGNEAGLRCALNSTAFDGWCTSPSIYFSDPAIPMFAMYSRCCTFHTGRVHARPAIPRVLDALATGFDPAMVTSAVVPWSDAAAAMSDPPMKLVISRL